MFWLGILIGIAIGVGAPRFWDLWLGPRVRNWLENGEFRP